MREADIDTIARALFRALDDAKCAGREPTHDFDVFCEDDPAWIEGWRAAARKAIALGARSTAADPRERIAELIGSDSTNFLGTGLSLREFAQLGHAEKLASAWAHQPREERRRRLDAVMRLANELARVRELTEFSTRLAELAIESVIEGDWKMVEEWAEHFGFADEGEELRQKFAPAFAIFRELLLQALRAAKAVPA